MARKAGTSVENNFVNGLVTEATGLNFPENAVTDSLNVEFDVTGEVSRRRGIDLEEGYQTIDITPPASDIYNEYIWKGVAGDGQRNFLVQQIGHFLYFFRSSGASALSANYLGFVDISPHALISGTLLDQSYCQFASGLGYLVVTHPYCESFFITYNVDTGAFSTTQYQIKTRDFRGVDPQPVPRMSSLAASHWYNLRNQGWSDGHIFDWSGKIGNYPSDYDVWWLYKTPDAFGIEQFLVDIAVSGGIVNNVNRGNSPAPKGSVIFTEFYQDRSAVSGVGGIPVVSSGINRPSTSAFHAGRIFYSGVNSKEYTSKIYFTQIVEHTTQFEKCYQENDPTSQYSPDLLASDGGVIAIANAGRIYRLWSTNNSLLVFASQGVWEITGSQGIGFSATDYTVKRISTASTNSVSSFVDVDGMPVWWGVDDIYIGASDTRLGGIAVKSLSEEKIQTFYEDIPQECRVFAKGAFNTKEKTVQWLYRTTVPSSTDTRQDYDAILVWNTKTNSFSPWSVPTSLATIRGISVLEGVGSSESTDPVTDLGVNVTDLGVVVTDTTEVSNVLSAEFKYTTRIPNGSLTYAQEDTTLQDWSSLSGGPLDYLSFFSAGYRVRGDANKNFQANYLTTYSTTSPPSRFKFKSMWDYANNGIVGRWSNSQVVNTTNSNYTWQGRRLKVRGHGKAMQFRVDSHLNDDFRIIGWSAFETVNSGV